MILDQEHVGTGSGMGLSIINDVTLRQDVAQSFTVGIAGILSSIEVQINNLSPDVNIIIDIRPVDGSGIPLASDASSLFSITLPPATFPNFFSFAFTSIDVSAAAIAVSPGDSLAITARAEEGGHFAWVLSDPGTYVNGSAHFRNTAGGSWSSSSSTFDAGFRTFVDQSVVPEPSSIVLFGAGMVGLLGFSRRNRSSRQ